MATLCCVAAAGGILTTFVASAPLQNDILHARPLARSRLAEQQSSIFAERGSIGATGVAGTWAIAGAALALVRGRSMLRAEQQEAETKKEEKKPFDVWEPSTYGNITMDDVKKYGAAGTLSYVITELIFWAIAFPTEIYVYLQTAGHWPDFNKPEESATVFGMVFAASNIARLLLPLRFGAALAMAPWVDENIMQRFGGGQQQEKIKTGEKAAQDMAARMDENIVGGDKEFAELEKVAVANAKKRVEAARERLSETTKP